MTQDFIVYISEIIAFPRVKVKIVKHFFYFRLLNNKTGNFDNILFIISDYRLNHIVELCNFFCCFLFCKEHVRGLSTLLDGFNCIVSDLLHHLWFCQITIMLHMAGYLWYCLNNSTDSIAGTFCHFSIVIGLCLLYFPLIFFNDGWRCGYNFARRLLCFLFVQLYISKFAENAVSALRLGNNRRKVFMCNDSQCIDIFIACTLTTIWQTKATPDGLLNKHGGIGST